MVSLKDRDQLSRTWAQLTVQLQRKDRWKVVAKHPQVNFRCSMVRNRFALDHAPTHSGVLEFAQALQSEFSMLAVAGDEDSKEKPPKNPKLRVLRREGV